MQVNANVTAEVKQCVKVYLDALSNTMNAFNGKTLSNELTTEEVLGAMNAEFDNLKKTAEEISQLPKEMRELRDLLHNKAQEMQNDGPGL